MKSLLGFVLVLVVALGWAIPDELRYPSAETATLRPAPIRLLQLGTPGPAAIFVSRYPTMGMDLGSAVAALSARMRVVAVSVDATSFEGRSDEELVALLAARLAEAGIDAACYIACADCASVTAGLALRDSSSTLVLVGNPEAMPELPLRLPVHIARNQAAVPATVAALVGGLGRGLRRGSGGYTPEW